MGTTKLKSSAMAKRGVNYVRSIIESSNSIFHEVHQENDYGNDAFVELVDEEDVKGITIAVQIKSGKSFCTKKSCSIPASKKHFQYWKEHSLPVIGIVYDPDEDTAYWTNIKYHIDSDRGRTNNGSYTITFDKTEFSSFTSHNFEIIFKPIHLKQGVKLSLDESIRFSESSDYIEHCIGLDSLVRLHTQSKEIWGKIFDIFKCRDTDKLDPRILYYMAHIPGHSDISWRSGQAIPASVRKSLCSSISSMSEYDIAKMLSLLDEGDCFERGTLGQSAESLIALVHEKEHKLLTVIENKELMTHTRDLAVILYAYYLQENAIGMLKQLWMEHPELRWAKVMAMQLEQEGYVCLY
ncbi:hypothetical protein PRUB_b0307 [Pseudoalteromonas rubra]|uniref:DUF4365 domain-containing protein n=1 Tax=Pseudoalteromonas rubra TaxID=43658 RepID=A0A8T0BZF3_9GAMM|nr:DUF4365 domain-containing protein [Pseudoalteromonas rubra]KAF7781169.1 hypothetical protein PRUB_b0307 [Pseudoalteromonas rubra]